MGREKFGEPGISGEADETDRDRCDGAAHKG